MGAWLKKINSNLVKKKLPEKILLVTTYTKTCYLYKIFLHKEPKYAIIKQIVLNSR